MNEIIQPSGALEESLLKDGVWASNTVGASMRPLLRHHKDMVIIQPITDEVKKYDVLLYRKPNGAYTLHRVIGLRPNEYLIRGDNTYFLERVPRDKVIGIMTEINRGGKTVRVGDTSYKIYSRIWNFIYPIRWLFYQIRRGLIRVYRFIFKRK